MTELQQNRYDRLLRRVGGLIGAKSMVNDALGELFPTIDVERVPGELLALMGTRLGVGRGNVNAGPGLRPQLQVFNPPNSGTIITITGLIISSVQTQTISWAISNAALTSLSGRGSLRDTRLRDPLSNTTVGEVRFQSTAVPIGGETEIILLANTPFRSNDENGIAVLSPGFGLGVEGTTVASQIIVSFLWRERAMEDAEFLVSG